MKQKIVIRGSIENIHSAVKQYRIATDDIATIATTKIRIRMWNKIRINMQYYELHIKESLIIRTYIHIKSVIRNIVITNIENGIY